MLTQSGLTQRGWWFFLTVLGVAAIGLAAQAVSVTLMALTVLAWFLGQWLAFTCRLRWVEGRWLLQREILDERGPAKTLWARLPFTVRVSLRCEAKVSLSFLSMIDRVPALMHERSGDYYADGPIEPGQP